MARCSECLLFTLLMCACCGVPLCSIECQRISHAQRIGADSEEMDEDAPTTTSTTARAKPKDATTLTFFHVPPGRHAKFGDRSVPRTEIMQQLVPLNGPPQPLYVEDKVFPPLMPFTTEVWAPIPIHLFKKNKDPKYLVQIHFSGKMVRTWYATTGWTESTGTFKSKDAAGNPIGRRRFHLKGKKFLASVLTAHAFWGEPPSKTRNFALHIVRVDDRGGQSDDSVRNIRWGTDKENKEDKTADGQASNNKGKKIAIYGKPEDKDKISLGLPPGVNYDPSFKDGTYARFDSMEDASRIINAHIDAYNRTAEKPLKGIATSSISAALSGKLKTAGGYAWFFDAVPEPAAADLRFLDESTFGERYVTRDGRILIKKKTKNGYVYVQITLRADPSGYIQTKLKKKAPVELGRSSQFNRIVAFLFNRAQLDAKLASTGLQMKDLEVDHNDDNTKNNAASNLIWRTRKEHVTKTHGHIIIETTKDRTHMTTFSTITAAAASANMSRAEFRSRINNGNGAAKIDYTDKTTRYFFQPTVPDADLLEDKSENKTELFDESEDEGESEDDDKMH
jgi:hypothetical protein